MKKKLLLILLSISSYTFSQDVLMQNGTVSQCSGTFYDSGGEFGNYGDGENLILTLCPEEAGQRIRLDFFEFATQLNADVMLFYDGDSTAGDLLGEYSGVSSPGFIGATLDNPTGCLTIEFNSSPAASTSGWAATISCSTPCQEITAQLDSTVPAANADSIVEVCVGDNITLNGSGNFEIDGTGATYEWDLGDGTTAFGESVVVSYDLPGVYLVDLHITDTNMDNFASGCPDSNQLNQVIRVSGRPDFTGTQAEDDTLCFGESTVIQGVANPLTLTYNCPPPESEVTFLPDGSGAAYSTCINVTCFEPDAVLTDISQIVDICLMLEHSYLGDLDIDIVSPNGQTVRLHDQGGGSANLGIPWATNQVDGESSNLTPGIGLEYCFVPGNAFPILIDGIIEDGEFPSGDGPDSYLDSYVPAGNYSSVEPLEGLIGSPLNGEWCIVIVDNLGLDNGYIFSWELNFNPDLDLQDFSYTPAIVSQSWDADSSIIETNGTAITVAPDGSGEYCYIFRTVDEFGCEYTEEVCINVAAEDQESVTYYEDLDGDGFGNPDASIEECADQAPNGYVDNNLDCNDVDILINPDADDGFGNGIDENCDGVDGNALSLNEFEIEQVRVSPNPFNSYLEVKVPSRLIGKQLVINIYDLNGREIVSETQIDIEGLITISDLDKLGKSTYFLKLSNDELNVNVVRKLVKF